MSAWRITAAAAADLADWAAMRGRLWPDDHPEEHGDAVAGLLVRVDGTALVLIARADDGVPAGFAEAAVRRDYVNGCDGSPVLFLDGLFVEAAWRARGLGRALVAAVADWGRSHGIAEFASDALLANGASHAFHRAVGFVETERAVFFRRVLA